MAIASLSSETRTSPDNILLPVLTKAKTYKDPNVGGMARVLCGIDANGVQRDEPNFADDMRKLNAGVWIEIPDDEFGGYKRVRLRAYIIVVAADYLAAQSVLPFVESTGAHLCCRHCTFDRTADDAYAPFSFLRKRATECCVESGEAEPAAKRQRSSPKLRQWPALQALLESLRGAEAGTDFSSIFSQHGLNKLHFAFDTKYFNFIDPMTVAPQDALHLFADGLLRSEGAWLFYILINKMGLKLEDANRRLRAFKGFTRGVRVPPFHEKLKEGAAGGVPSSSSVMRMTGSQMHEFAKHRCASRSCASRPCICHGPLIRTHTLQSPAISVVTPL